MADHYLEDLENLTILEILDVRTNLVLAILTSPQWRDRFTQNILLPPLMAGDADAWLSYYTSRDRPIPAWVGRTLIENRKPKKGGRHTRPEERARQRASDVAAYLSVEQLLARGLTPTRACSIVGELMNLTRQSVMDACKREKARKLSGNGFYDMAIPEGFRVEDEDDYNFCGSAVDEMNTRINEFNELFFFIPKSE